MEGNANPGNQVSWENQVVLDKGRDGSTTRPWLQKDWS